MTKPTQAQIDAVLRYLPLLQRPELVASQSDGGETDEEGTFALPSEQHSSVVSGLISDLYRHGFIKDFDWPSWQDHAQRYVSEPEKLKEADLGTLKKLLTVHVRKDRFCEGHFTAMIECGHVAAILQRLAEIRLGRRS